MLKDSEVMAMVAVIDIEVARKFYGETLGLGEGEVNPAGVLYISGGGKLFVYQAPTAGTNRGTSATWNVDDIHAVVDKLTNKGVRFQHYEFPGAEYDGEYIHLMFGEKGAWFKDPDGNTLGLVETKKP